MNFVPRKLSALADWIDVSARWVYLLLVAIAAISVAVLLFLLVGAQNSIRDQQNKIEDLSSENADRIRDIEQSRYSLVFNGCLDTNERNRNTRATLDAIIAGVEDPRQRAAAEASKQYTILIIDAIAPVHKNCAVYAKRRIQESK